MMANEVRALVWCLGRFRVLIIVGLGVDGGAAPLEKAKALELEMM
jgi:hypothetical protein